MNNYLIIISWLLVLVTSMYGFTKLLSKYKVQLIKWAIKQKGKLKIKSINDAIMKADKIKQKTGRKAIVFKNSTTGNYDAIDKKTLKSVANASKRKKGRTITHQRIQAIQQKSLYVTSN